MDIPEDVIARIVRHALREDVGNGDRTTLAVIPAEIQAEALVVFREAGVVAGLPVVQSVFAQLDPTMVVEVIIPDGSKVEAGTTVALIRGNARHILTGERVALNFLQRMSGIATLTADYVAAIGSLPTRLLDTRKTTPGLRVLEKYAVVMGGGVNHRSGLYDAVLLKDNHLAVLASLGIGIAEAVRRARSAVGPLIRIEVEADTVAQACEAAEAGADMILLDNMSPDRLREAVTAIAGRAIIEASGGISRETIRAVAETGVPYISVGALTHSARALDIGLDWHTGK